MERYSDFNKVYVEHKAMVFNFVLIRTNNREVSEEITSDVFVKVAECMDVFNPEIAKFTTWMLTIATNKIKDYYRSLQTVAKLGEVYLLIVLLMFLRILKNRLLIFILNRISNTKRLLHCWIFQLAQSKAI